MESNQITKKRYKKILLIGLFIVLLLVIVCVFKSCSVDSPEKGQENISMTDKDDAIDKEENKEQHNQTDIEQADDNENELIHNTSSQSTMKPTESSGNNNSHSSMNNTIAGGLGAKPEQSIKPENPTDNNSDSNTGSNDNNDNSSTGPQDNNNQMDSDTTPEQPDLPEEDEHGNVLKLLYNELRKANKTFQYFLELTDEILENY